METRCAVERCGAEWNRSGTVSRRSSREPCFLTDTRKREFTHFNPFSPSFLFGLFNFFHPRTPVFLFHFCWFMFWLLIKPGGVCTFREFILSCLTVQLIPFKRTTSSRFNASARQESIQPLSRAIGLSCCRSLGVIPWQPSQKMLKSRKKILYLA